MAMPCIELLIQSLVNPEDLQQFRCMYIYVREETFFFVDQSLSHYVYTYI